METEAKTLHGLPEKVIFCKTCVMSNQRPSTTPEHHKKDTKISTAAFTEDGICHACLHAKYKRTQIDWNEREKNLKDILDKHRRPKGSTDYDVLVPGSGGKDSIWVSHVLKYKYGMNPLTITWAPHMYTEVGWKNFQNWIHSGFDNVLHTPNGKTHRILTRLAFDKLCNPFQPFIMGQKFTMAKIAKRQGIKLIMYGEHQAEYHNKIEETKSSRMDPLYFTRPSKSIEDLRFASLTPEELEPHGVDREDLLAYAPIERSEMEDAGIDVHFLGYFMFWIPQEAYYYSVKYSKFEPNPYGRSEGTYSKYASLDDRIDGLNYYTMHTKFGQGRATNDAAHEVRDGHITRDEAVRLVRKFDGEFPIRYYKDILDYMGITDEHFHRVVDANRSPHLWEKVDGKWKLKHQVS